MKHGRTFAVGSAWLAVLAIVVYIDRGITDSVTIVNHTPDALRFALIAEVGGFDLVAPAAPGISVTVLSGSQLSDGAGLMRDRCTVGDP